MKEHKTFNIDVKASLEQLQKYRKIRWEFLRLNKDYRVDYDNLMNESGNKNQKNDHYTFEIWLAEKAKEFSKKWLIMPHHYNNDTPPLSTDPYYEPVMTCPSNFPNVGVKCVLPLKGLPVENGALTVVFQTIMGIQINPLFPQGLILGIIKWMLDGLEYEKTVTLAHTKNPIAKNRMRLQDYKSCLRVYKLKNKNPEEKMPYTSLAALFFKIEKEKVTDVQVQSVFKWYKKAKELVRQGIRGFPPIKVHLATPTVNR